jgi:cellobiose phosphorylase
VILRRGALRIDPCIPSSWNSYEVTYRTAAAEFRITVENPDGVCRGVKSVEIDGIAREDRLVPLAESAPGVHEVRVVLGVRGE